MYIYTVYSSFIYTKVQNPSWIKLYQKFIIKSISIKVSQLHTSINSKRQTILCIFVNVQFLLVLPSLSAPVSMFDFFVKSVYQLLEFLVRVSLVSSISLFVSFIFLLILSVSLLFKLFLLLLSCFVSWCYYFHWFEIRS